MTIESIQNIQPSANIQYSEPNSTEVKSIPIAADKSKDIMAALFGLAAIGAGGVAVYKHKSAKKAIEKAEKEAQQKIKEAEEKAKKAAEDAEKKINEILNSQKNEKPENLPPVVDETSDKIAETADTEFINNDEYFNDTRLPRVLEGGILDTDLKEVASFLYNKEPDYPVNNFKTAKSYLKSIKNFFSGIFKRKAQRNPQPELNKKLEQLEQEQKTFIDYLNKIFTEKAKTSHVKVDLPDKETFERELKAAIEENKDKEITIIDVLNGLFEKYLSKKINPVKEDIKAGASEPDEVIDELTEIFPPFIKHLEEGSNGIIFIPSKCKSLVKRIKSLFTRPLKPTKEAQDIYNKFNKKLDGKFDFEFSMPKPITKLEHDKNQALYELMHVPEPQPSDIFRGIGNLIPKAESMSEKDLLTEYNALLSFIKTADTNEPATRRFSELTDVIIGKMTNKELIKEYRALKNIKQNTPEQIRFNKIKDELSTKRGYEFTGKDGNPVQRQTAGSRDTNNHKPPKKKNWLESFILWLLK